jgi:hypothetical protein
MKVIWEIGEIFFKFKDMQKSESRIQQECVEWFRNKCIKERLPYLLLSIPNDNQKFLKGTGLLKGASDLIMVVPNKVFWIEMKTQKGRQSPEQKAFELSVNNLGFEYLLFRSLEEFQEWCERNVFG